MKKISVAVLGLLLGSSFSGANPASAADMPDVIPLSAPSWSWTGFYFGAHLGGGFANTQFRMPEDLRFTAARFEALRFSAAGRAVTTGKFQTRILFWVSRLIFPDRSPMAVQPVSRHPASLSPPIAAFIRGWAAA